MASKFGIESDVWNSWNTGENLGDTIDDEYRDLIIDWNNSSRCYVFYELGVNLKQLNTNKIVFLLDIMNMPKNISIKERISYYQLLGND